MSYQEYWLNDFEHYLVIKDDEANYYIIDIFMDCSSYELDEKDVLELDEEHSLVYAKVYKESDIQVLGVFFIDKELDYKQLISLRITYKKELEINNIKELREKARRKLLAMGCREK